MLTGSCIKSVYLHFLSKSWEYLQKVNLFTFFFNWVDGKWRLDKTSIFFSFIHRHYYQVIWKKILILGLNMGLTWLNIGTLSPTFILKKIQVWNQHTELPLHVPVQLQLCLLILLSSNSTGKYSPLIFSHTSFFFLKKMLKPQQRLHSELSGGPS